VQNRINMPIHLMRGLRTAAAEAAKEASAQAAEYRQKHPPVVKRSGVARISAACKKGKHASCSMLNCTCKCAWHIGGK